MCFMATKKSLYMDLLSLTAIHLNFLHRPEY